MSEHPGQRKHPHLTPAAVLAWMEPGCDYLPLDIAKAFAVEARYAWEVVRLLCRRGDVVRVSNDWRQYRYGLAKRRVPMDTSIAGPAYAPDLRAHLRGYDAEMRQRAELAMCARRRS